MMQTAAPARSSSSANLRPDASFQLPVSNQALVLPVTLVDQLRPLPTTVTLARPSGATAATPPICARIASASVSLNDGAPPPPPGRQALALAGAHHQQVGAEAGDLLLHRLRGALAQRDHRDHRAHADHDAQDGQERAQQVAPDRSQREETVR